jgi:broad specificity phosphatase PhoE
MKQTTIKKKRIWLSSIGFFATVIIVIALVSCLPKGAVQKKKPANYETIFYITRHAETEANVNGLLVGGGGDSSLTDKGKKQAEALGKGLQGIVFDKCCTSELGRAKTTARMILNQSGNQKIRINEDQGLNDLDWGSLEGKSIAEIQKNWPDFSIEAAIGDGTDPKFISVSGSETRYACTQRISKAMNQLAADKSNRGKRILITAHSSMAWFIASLSDHPEDYSSIDNASVSVLIYRNQKWRIADFNDTDYGTMKQRLERY